jgi:hypothetical protein
MTHCPICGAEVEELDRTGDAEGFDCAHHGKFKVAGSVLSINLRSDRAQWERALEMARARATEGRWPTIVTTDF